MMETESTTMMDMNNREQRLAYDLIAHTNSSFFLTGRAGTGKTTFLRNVQNTVDKQFVVVAPTGVAAILAGGETIHSFFGLPMEVCAPGTVGRLNPERLQALCHADTIIVDEASMVRCDIVDAMDTTLRHVMRNSMPFGGKQMVFVGDMFQLPPIVRKGGELDYMRELYGAQDFFFYNAHVVQRMYMVKIEFRKVYRQDDARFLSVLSDVRAGQLSDESLALLNTRVAEPKPGDGLVITLAPLNNVANRINQKRLAELPDEEFVYEGSVQGTFEEKRMPVDRELCLRVGAQVMFTRNDSQRRWVNGTLGRVVALGKDGVQVQVQDGDTYAVSQCSWESVTYQYDRKAHRLTRQVTGTFVQYPLRLAWAITVHKSQGMTFDRMRLDLSRGLFADGQLYVALSRVRSLDGLYLTRSIAPHNVRTSKAVLAYAAGYNDERRIAREIESGKAVYDALRRDDYDEAARQYLLLVAKRSAEGDVKEAMQQAKRFLDTVVCDEHLYGCVSNVPAQLVGASHWAPCFLAALLALYAQDYVLALTQVDKVLALHQCVEALYVKARCLTRMERYAEADATYDLMAECEHPLDCNADAKVLCAAALFNEHHTSQSGLDLARIMVEIRPKYDRGLMIMRSLMRARTVHLPSADGEERGILVEAFDSAMADEDFLALLRDTRAQDPSQVKALLKLLGKCHMK